jgi:hypothetical protein
MPTSSGSPLPPPSGYGSWLEYALSTFDVRSILVDASLDGGKTLHREDVLAAVWAELNELRVCAGLPPVDPKGSVFKG